MCTLGLSLSLSRPKEGQRHQSDFREAVFTGKVQSRKIPVIPVHMQILIIAVVIIAVFDPSAPRNNGHA